MTTASVARTVAPVPDNVTHLLKDTVLYAGLPDYVYEITITASASEGSPQLELHRTLGRDPHTLVENALAHAERAYFVPRKNWREFSTSTLAAVHNSYRMQLLPRRLET